MNRESEHDELLGEVFAPEFREALLGDTLRRVRRRRQFRRARRAAAVLALAGVSAILFWQNVHGPKPLPRQAQERTVEKSYTLVHTAPLPASAIVTTHSLSEGQFVASSAAIQIVETKPGQFRFIGDNELLELLAPHPVALVRIGPNSEKLVFADPEEEKQIEENRN